MSNYTEYYKLTLYQRQCLPATNLWRIRQGKHSIAIPPNEELPMVCGPETKQDEVIAITKISEQSSYMDFTEVEKPVLRDRKQKFYMMEFLEMEGCQ